MFRVEELQNISQKTIIFIISSNQSPKAEEKHIKHFSIITVYTTRKPEEKVKRN